MKRCKKGFERSSTTDRCIKKCIRGKARNPSTNRCKKITLRRCKTGYERSSTNNRCIKKCVRGKIRNKTTNRCRKKCARGERRNPVTGRCIRKKAAPRVRRVVPRVVPRVNSVLPNMVPSHSTRTRFNSAVPNLAVRPISLHLTHNDNLNNTGNACKMHLDDLRRVEEVLNLAEIHVGNNDICQELIDMFPMPIVPSGWTITRMLGNGAFGVALGTRGPRGQAGAVKLLKENDLYALETEIEMGEEYHNVGLSPKSEKVSSFEVEENWYHAIHMDRLDGTLDSVLIANPPTHRIERIVEKVFEVIDKMDQEKLSHGDFHWGNIGFVHARDGQVGKIQVIDHGFSSKGMGTPELEVAQLLRVADLMRFHDGLSQATFDVLDAKIRQEVRRRFGVDRYPRGFQELGDFMNELAAEAERRELGLDQFVAQ